MDGALKVENYGHERLWGAVSWGLMHLIIGGIIDIANGTYILYYAEILSAIAYSCLLLLWKKRKNGLDRAVRT